jgi:hypothetical protein
MSLAKINAEIAEIHHEHRYRRNGGLELTTA